MRTPGFAPSKPTSLDRWLFVFGFTICFLSLNPVFHAIGIKGSVLLLSFLALTLLNGRIVVSPTHRWSYVFLVAFIATSWLSSAYNNTLTPLTFALFFSLAFLCMIQTPHQTAVRYVQIATRLMTAFVVLAIIGMFYHLAGGSPLITLVNPDGRDNAFYLTTFSNAEAFVIRPSAIYDEPGAFSFYLCVLVTMRSLLGMSIRTSGLLLLGGLVTQSMTHIIFMAVWFCWVSMSASTKRSKNISAMLGFLSIALLVYWTGVLDWAFERAIEFYENPWLNPRQRSFDEILYNLESGGLWFGFSDTCVQRLPECTELGENPLSPLIYGGLLAAWPYYAFLIFAFCAPLFSRRGLLYAGLGVLLLQRPYLLEFPYSAVFALIAVIALGRGATLTRVRHERSNPLLSKPLLEPHADLWP